MIPWEGPLTAVEGGKRVMNDEGISNETEAEGGDDERGLKECRDDEGNR